MHSTNLLRPSSCPPVSTADVAARISAEQRGAPVLVTGLTNRSAEVRAGDLFVGVPGSRAHGASFAREAIAAGAVAVLTDRDGAGLTAGLGVPVLIVEDLRVSLGPAAAQVYGDPSRKLRMLGITGTSGKTTTAYMIRTILESAGLTSGLIGTVETLIGGQSLAQTPGASFTTPEAPDLHALLAVMVEREVTDVVMEVSSHALQLGRVGGIEFAVAGFANLSQDHLDFHHTMDEYFAAKSLLFDGRAACHVLNVDDSWVARVLQRPRPTVTISPSGGDADWRVVGGLDGADAADGGSRFTATGPGGLTVELNLSLPGAFNGANALMALAVTHRIGIDPQQAARALASVRVPGRMERIDAGQPFLALVDYSHKPAAVEAALKSVRRQVAGRVLLVLGCGGDRDAGKRPLMGEVAARGSDILVVTDDNPRSEDPAAIRAAMLAGARSVPKGQRGELLEIGDRAQAIREAVRRAGCGDVVLVAGKGHETGQYVGDVVYPFDDREALRSALRELGS